MEETLYLGTGIESGVRVTLDPDHLTTHAVCLGMTGSGKTGLGIVALEELARRGVPLLVVDLKGDMVDLLLNFPGLDPADFERWLPADAAEQGERAAVAAKVAALWRGGLERSGLGPAEMEAARSGVRWQLLTPGVASAAPLDILPTLSAPAGWHPGDDPDAASERVNGLTSALLSLIGRGGDPLTDRDQVLVASIVLEHWRRSDALDLARLLASIVDPPMASLGALALDSFYPRDDRMKLVMALNTLLASPAFAAWTTGVPLAIEALLGTSEEPRASIVSVAHLDERQRLFILSLIASELVAWMRRQPASSGLRALLYIDEVQGILPPYPANPPTKGPLLTLLKQGRAFGVGAWLATQNPVDLDYKALGNAGVKLVGRLVTERDRERALEGLKLDRLPDEREVDEVVAGLGKRQFVLDDVRAEHPEVFASRWAMSYLRGPVTLAEMEPLLGPRDGVGEAAPAPSPAARPAEPVHASPPVLATDLPVRFAPDAAGEARPVLLVRNRVTVERRTFGLFREQEELWTVPAAPAGGLDLEGAERLEAAPEVVDEPPPGMSFPVAVPTGLERALKRGSQAFVTWRARRPLVVLANRRLKLAAEVGEERDAFLERCLEAADEADDARQDRVRRRYAKRVESLRRRLGRERDELERDRQQLEARKAEEKLGLVEGLFSVLLGSRSVRSAAGKAASRARTAAGKRRMRQQAEASVEESEHELDRIDAELDGLAEEMEAEVEEIAAESERRAAEISEEAVRPKRADVVVLELVLVWQ